MWLSSVHSARDADVLGVAATEAFATAAAATALAAAVALPAVMDVTVRTKRMSMRE